MNNSKIIAKTAIVAAIYFVISMLIEPLTYGSIQIRFAEALLILVFYNKKYSYSLIIGCFLVNLFSPLGIIDIVFGTLATVIVCVLINKLKNVKYVPIVAAIVNGVIVGIDLNIILKVPLFITIITVAIGEFVAVLLGFLIFNKKVIKRLKIEEIKEIKEI